MADRLPHIIARIIGDIDVDFALVPITAELIEVMADQLKSSRTLANLAEVAFWDGHPVFFEQPGQDFTVEPYLIAVGRPDVHWRHFKRVDRIHHVLYRNEQQWMVRWGAERNSIQFETVAVPLSVLAATRTSHLGPTRRPL